MTEQEFETAAPAADAASFPWPPQPGDSIVTAIGSTWRGASLAPRTFFADLPASSSLGSAILYYLLIGVAVAGAELFWSMVTAGVETRPMTAFGSTGAWSPLLGFFFSPVLLLVGLFMAAGVTHLILALFGGAHGGFGMTNRVFCYAYSPMILGVIPKVGSYAGTVWMVVIAIIGLREAHRTTTARAAAAVLIPFLVLIVLYALAELLIHAAGLLDMPVA